MWAETSLSQGFSALVTGCHTLTQPTRRNMQIPQYCGGIRGRSLRWKLGGSGRNLDSRPKPGGTGAKQPKGSGVLRGGRRSRASGTSPVQRRTIERNRPALDLDPRRPGALRSPDRARLHPRHSYQLWRHPPLAAGLQLRNEAGGPAERRPAGLRSFAEVPTQKSMQKSHSKSIQKSHENSSIENHQLKIIHFFYRLREQVAFCRVTRGISRHYRA